MSPDCQVRIIVLETQVNKTVPPLGIAGHPVCMWGVCPRGLEFVGSPYRDLVSGICLLDSGLLSTW